MRSTLVFWSSVLVIGCRAAPPPEVVQPAAAPVVRADQVETDRGPVAGIVAPSHRAFLGIPYAAPPIGPLRYAAPIEHATWSEPRDATKLGAPCIQPDSEARGPSSEDCLTLNIWTPNTKEAAKPVLVWIHGGAFFQGSGGDAIYEGTKLAVRTGAVVVTFNYRLGALGFLAHPALGGGATFGILDQRAALTWVAKNIAKFGGDPRRVTVFGESAGAWSICVHLASPKSYGLFARAIMQSGACENAIYFNRSEAIIQGGIFAQRAGCTGDNMVDCLRRIDARDLIKLLPMKRSLLLPPGVWWGPVVDGVDLPREPMEAIRRGEFARVPMMVGANRDEGTLHTIGFKEVTAQEVQTFAEDVFGELAATKVPERYNRPVPKDNLTDIVTDGIFVCEARRIARAATAAKVPVYLYHFTRALADPRVHALGATHSVDLFFLWGNIDLGYGIAPEEIPLSESMMDAWGSFARDGVPSGAPGAWPLYTIEGDEHRVLDLPLDPATAIGRGLKSEICDFWDGL